MNHIEFGQAQPHHRIRPSSRPEADPQGMV